MGFFRNRMRREDFMKPESNNGKIVTVPNMSLSVIDIFERYRMNLPLPQASSYYDEDIERLPEQQEDSIFMDRLTREEKIMEIKGKLRSINETAVRKKDFLTPKKEENETEVQQKTGESQV